jgi:hypothetical protein
MWILKQIGTIFHQDRFDPIFVFFFNIINYEFPQFLLTVDLAY